MTQTRNHTHWFEKLRANCLNLLTAEAKDIVELVFSVLLIFMLTCVGAMLMICFFFEVERKSPHSQRLNDRQFLTYKAGKEPNFTHPPAASYRS
jgi:hypothetical protein